MPRTRNMYDVIIIGSGIGGLICGCYLAKAGKKVLILERNTAVGGYCTSFTRGGFTFDTGIHALEGCGKNGILAKIIGDLELNSMMKITKIDPSDILITPFGKFHIRNNIEQTIDEFKANFPNHNDELQSFFKFILGGDFVSKYITYKNASFAEFIDYYFHNSPLATIFSMLLLNVGLPPNKLAAINGLIFLKQYLSDGGYYPQGGMSTFTNAFARKIQYFGGEILLNTQVKKIVTKNRRVIAVATDNNIFKSSNIISNCDVTQTYIDLIDDVEIKKRYESKLKSMTTSISAFIVYMGLNKDCLNKDLKCGALWYLTKKDKNAGLETLFNGKVNYNHTCIMIGSPSMHDKNLAPINKTGIYIVCNANFKNLGYWDNHKEMHALTVINIAKEIIPDIDKYIQLKIIATPQTLHRYTLNRNGAIHGWAALLSQIDPRIIPMKSNISGLYLTGHWITHPGEGGIPMVANSAYHLANNLLKSVRGNK